MRYLTTLLLAIQALAAAAVAQKPKPKAPVAFALVSDVDSVVPGRTLVVGIHLRHQPGWHTYWKNPGTAGLATTVAWQLPEGWVAGELIWPRPQRTKMGDYTVWGYEGEAVLLTEITIPARSASTAETVEISARVGYMACARTCHPGTEKLVLRLPVGRAARPVGEWKSRFAAVRGEQPEPLPAGWTLAATRQAEVYHLVLTPPEGIAAKVGGLYFFSADRQISSDAPQVLQREGGRWSLRLAREAFTPSDGDRLRGQLYCVEGLAAGGSPCSFAVDVLWKKVPDSPPPPRERGKEAKEFSP